MAQRSDLQTGVIDDALELTPVELPERNMAPSIDERVGRIEAVLNIS